ncbi:hypothetical protein CBOM_06705 [Ceraceosorus bombacis]|uniref:Zinc finger Mcm10/DnaG-type domain-containing protein n=1 Tax=Ceraceosorus bombacis TaxID=401625 RepID=A0A0P1BSZ9_9BASI|nr:hypothetical protein CBOM_06705 [Ceraceosorus bombacis]
MDPLPRILAPSTPTNASRYHHTSLASRTREGVEIMRRAAAQQASTSSRPPPPLPIAAAHVQTSHPAASAQSSRASFADRMSAAPRRHSAHQNGQEGDDADEQQGNTLTPARDERLRVVETLKRGPRDLGAAAMDDAQWDTFEPNSRTRLKQRRVSNVQVHGWLESRYHLSPSTLYSIVDPKPTNLHGDYKVPVVGEWLTMAVIVEMSPVKISKGKQWKPKPGTQKGESYIHPDSDVSSHDEADQHLDDEERKRRSNERRKARFEEWHAKQKLKKEDKRREKRQEKQKRKKDLQRAGLPLDEQDEKTDEDADSEDDNANSGAGRKYMILRLQDLGADARGGGDEMLTMMVFQAVKEDRILNQRSKWRGGSGGAFERLVHERPGALLCITNPRISNSAGLLVPAKPGGKSTAASKVFKLKLVHDSTMTIIGQVADFNRCQAMTREGDLCSAYVDGRSGSKVCQVHFEASLKNSGGKRHDLANTTTDWRYAAASSDLKINPNFGSSSFVRDPAERLFQPSSSSSGRTAGKHVRRGPAVIGEGALLAASDPNSHSFDAAAYYGRGKADKQARRKKAWEEAGLIFQLEARLGHGSTHHRQLSAQQQLRGSQPLIEASEHDDTVLGGSVAARALLSAQSTLERQRESPASRRRGVKRNSESVDRDQTTKRLPARQDRIPGQESTQQDKADLIQARSAYGPEMIKRLGFDPLAGRRSQQNTKSAPNSTTDNRMRLLARHESSHKTPDAATSQTSKVPETFSRVDSCFKPLSLSGGFKI